VIVCSRAQPLEAGALVVRRCEKDDRDEAIFGDGLDDPTRIDAIQARHVDVEHHEVDRLGTDRVDGLLAAVSLDDRQPARAE
jgi:hypothetical protein